MANAGLGYHFMADRSWLVAAAILGAGLLAAIAAWILIVTTEFVADASMSYTEQLLACCDALVEKPAAV